MPELPDIVVTIEGLSTRVLGQRLEKVRLARPFLLRSVSPPLSEVEGKKLLEIRRLGKRIVLGFEDELFLVIHLMIAGRFRWRPRGAAARGIVLAAFDFSSGTLLLTEAGSKKRASLHVVRGEEGLHQHDPGGLEILEADLARFRAALLRERHTLKRALTDPRIFSGIGNAYSDEILHRARLSPARHVDQLHDDEIARLLACIGEVLLGWTEKIRVEAGERFPENVTAFREGMAVHGRYGKPCPACGTTVQRIVYAENEANYCPRCQTGGKLLADRALSRLLRGDWPRTIDDLESRRA